jgi:hypothetical protein
MVRTPVKSSVLAAVDYDPATRRLEVEFHNGRLYRYEDVNPLDVTALLTADSVGGYFNKRIRKKYRGVRIWRR